MTLQSVRPGKNAALFEESLRSPEPLWELHGVARALLAQGYDRDALIQEIAQFKDELGDAGREADWEVMTDLLDFFEGWCLPHLKL